MGLKALIPGTAASAKKGHKQYLRRKVRGHDVLLQVQWADRTMTEMAADYRVEDNKFIATNGLRFHVEGQGAEPFMWYGVPTVRVHALCPCPFDATSCIHADLDEATEYEVVVRDDGGREVVRYTPEPEPNAVSEAASNVSKRIRGDGGAADESTGPTLDSLDDETTVEGIRQQVDAADEDGEAQTDGGMAVVKEAGRQSNIPVKPGKNVDKIYDMEPPDGCVGWAFSLENMGQRVVNSLPPKAIKDAEERGKQSVRQGNEPFKMFVLGLAGGVGFVFFILFLWYVLQSIFGGGGGGGAIFGTLPLAVGSERTRQRLSTAWDVFVTAVGTYAEGLLQHRLLQYVQVTLLIMLTFLVADSTAAATESFAQFSEWFGVIVLIAAATVYYRELCALVDVVNYSLASTGVVGDNGDGTPVSPNEPYEVTDD